MHAFDLLPRPLSYASLLLRFSFLSSVVSPNFLFGLLSPIYLCCFVSRFLVLLLCLQRRFGRFFVGDRLGSNPLSDPGRVLLSSFVSHQLPGQVTSDPSLTLFRSLPFQSGLLLLRFHQHWLLTHPLPSCPNPLRASSRALSWNVLTSRPIHEQAHNLDSLQALS
jgi:hypothetical protein